MGIDIDSKLMLVHSKAEISKLLEQNTEEDFDIWELLNDFGLDSASPYYDSDTYDRVIGISISPPTYRDLTDQGSDWWFELKEAADKLNSIFGEGELTLDSYPNVW